MPLDETQGGEQAVQMDQAQAQRLWNEVTAGRGGDAPAAEPQAAAPAGDAAPAADDAAAQPQSQEPAAAAPPPPPPTVEELRAELAQFRSATERRVRNAEGIAGSAIQRAKAAEERLAALQAAPTPAQPSAAEIARAAEDPETWKRLKQDYPELATAIDDRLGAMRGDEDTVRRLEAKHAQELEARDRAAREREEAMQQRLRVEVVEAIHPGWQSICATPKFKQWLLTADAESKALAASDSPSDAVRVLNRFKFGADEPASQHLSSGRTAADLARERQERLANAVTPARSSSGSSSAKALEAMTEQEVWDAHIAAKQRAREQGARR